MKINTANLIVQINNISGELMTSRAAPYLYNGDAEPDISVNVSRKFYEEQVKKTPGLTFEESEYLYSGWYFYEQFTNFGGIMLHASCVEYKGKAYLFSANSGTGKSTHTHLWLRYLDGARIINDDKPAIRLIDGTFYAFGTPWSGKTDESVYGGVPVGGIAFLSRGENNIERVDGFSVLMNFLNQTVRPRDKALMSNTLDILDKLLTSVPVYRFSCDMSEEAVKTAVNGMVNR